MRSDDDDQDENEDFERDDGAVFGPAPLNTEMDDEIPFDDVPLKRRRLVPVRWTDTTQLTPQEPLVAGVLDRGCFSMCYGATNVGKSFVHIDLAARVALGWPWQGRAVRQGAAIFVAPDGGRGLRPRIEAWRRFHRVEADAPFYVVADAIDLVHGDDTGLLLQRIAELPEDARHPELIIVDTLSRAFGGSNENGSEGMGPFVANCDRIRADTGAHVCVIHHAGKKDGAGARGHSLLKAALDSEIEITKAGNIITARVTKQRDHAEGDEFRSELREIEIGRDVAGAAITTCVVAPATAKDGGKLPPTAAKALMVLRACIEQTGEAVPGLKGSPPGARAVTFERWRHMLAGDGLINPNGNPRQQFKRHRVTLENAGLIGTSDEFAWCVT